MRYKSLDEWLKWLESFHPKEIDLGLERVKAVYQALHPSPVKPFTITVAGTNGKGSCVAMLNAIFLAEGYRVGAYTSPHLLKYNERIVIQGQAVSDQEICEAFHRVDQARGETSLTYFEFGTLAVLDIFCRSDLDVQLLEVGLGGRLDAVNIVNTDIALVTGIEIDHSDLLGDSREAIGMEKAGIFRSNVSAVAGDPNPPNSLIDHARKTNVPLFQVGRDFHFRMTDNGWKWFNETHALENLPLPKLRGSQQLGNAAVVIQTLHLVKEQLPVAESSIRRGLEEGDLVGRFQLISSEYPNILLDVAHNPQSAEALAFNLNQVFPERRIHAVFAIMKDKDIEGVLLPMKNVIDHWYLSPLEMTRAASVSELVDRFKQLKILRVDYGFIDFDEVFETAKQNCKEDDLIVIFGSFFLVAKYLENVQN